MLRKTYAVLVVAIPVTIAGVIGWSLAEFIGMVATSVSRTEGATSTPPDLSWVPSLVLGAVVGGFLWSRWKAFKFGVARGRKFRKDVLS